MVMKLHYEKPDDDIRIEIIPLIDVIFCILTFFILAAVTLTRQTAINVDLPRAGTGQSQLRELLIVSVDPIGQTYIEKQPVTREQLHDAMLKFRQTSPDGLIVLYASRASSYNDVVQVLDLLRSVGGSRVALATLPGNSGGTGSAGDAGSPGNNSPLQLPGFPELNNQGGSNPSSPGASSDPSGAFQLPGLNSPAAPPTGTSPNAGDVTPDRSPGSTAQPGSGRASP